METIEVTVNGVTVTVPVTPTEEIEDQDNLLEKTGHVVAVPFVATGKGIASASATVVNVGKAWNLKRRAIRKAKKAQENELIAQGITLIALEEAAEKLRKEQEEEVKAAVEAARAAQVQEPTTTES